MMPRIRQFVVLGCIAAAFPLMGDQQKAVVSTETHMPGVHDVSPPLRDIQPSDDVMIKRVYDPLISTGGTSDDDHVAATAGVLPEPSKGTDTVMRMHHATTESAPTWLNPTAFIGQGLTMPGYVLSGEPPDTEGAIGKNYFVQVVNSSIGVFDRAGATVLGPIPINTLFQGFPKTDGNRCAANNDGDPIIYYDQLADRWVISQFDVTRPSGATADYQCLAVSTSGDPTGTYYRWDYQIPGGMMGDYEKIGLWPDGYYMTLRAFNTAGAFQGSKCLIFDRSKLLVGAPDATQLDTGYLCTNAVQATPCTALRTQDGFTPMSLDGFNPPPAGAADAIAKYSGGNAIRFYWLKVNSNSDGSWAATPTVTVSGPQNVTVTAFTAAAQSQVVPQPGTTVKLDSLGNNLMYRLAYRNYGTQASPDEQLVVNHTVTGATAPATIKWYQFKNAAAKRVGDGVTVGTAAPVVVYDERYEPNATSRWMGSIALDKFKNVGIGYNVSDGTSTYPGIAINGRQPGDPITPRLLQGETIVQAGSGSNNVATRWGDYSQTSIDPLDDCTFWYTSEYFANTGDFNWSTAFVQFRFPNCLACTAPATPTGLTVKQNSATSYTVSWAASTGAGSYSVYRDTAACPNGTPVRIATCPGAAGCTPNGSSYTYTDSSAILGTQYWYSVTAIDAATSNCESIRSTCVSGATGSCQQQPAFAGLATADAYTILAGGVVVNNGCSIHLSWSAGTSNCPDNPAIGYNIYRAPSATFTPDPTPGTGNMIKSCAGGTTFDDNSSLTAGTTYYYIVRAEDSTTGNGGPCNGGNQDKNTVRISAAPGVYAQAYYENFDATAVNALPAGWTQAGQWRGVQNCAPAFSGNNTLHWGATTCNGQYAINANDDATSPTVTIPATTTNARLVFYHRWNMAGSVRDGLHLRVNVAGTIKEVPYTAFLGGDYTASRNSDNGDGCGTTLPYKGLGIWGGQQNAFKKTTIDLDAVCGGAGQCAGKNLSFIFTGLSNCTATNDIGWFVDDVEVIYATSASCAVAPEALQVLSATSSNGQNKLEWLSGGTGSRVQVRYRTDAYPSSANDGTAVTGTPLTITVNSKGSVVHSGLTNGTTYYYSIFADTGAGTITSSGKSLAARPQDTVTGPVKWIYNTGAASLTPPGVPPVYSVSNDRILHSMAQATGDWPTNPSNWTPFLMSAASQARPPVPTVTIGGSPRKVVYLGAQDGRVYCIDANTGAQIWRTNALAPAGSIIQTSPGLSANFGLVLVGTRLAGSDNIIYALNAATGATAWSFNNGGGANGIGILTGDPSVDDSTNRAYFTSRARVGGSSGTVWCLSYNASSASNCAGYPLSAGDIDSSMIQWGNKLYVGNNSGVVYSYNITTAAQNWSYATADGPIKGFINPDWSGATNDLYFATTNKVWALTDNTNSATPRWSLTTIALPSIPLFTSNSVLVGSSDGKLYEITSLASATPTLHSATLGAGTAAVGSPSLDYATNQVYVGTDAGRIYATVWPLP